MGLGKKVRWREGKGRETQLEREAEGEKECPKWGALSLKFVLWTKDRPFFSRASAEFQR